LNATAAVLLICGYIAIKRRNIVAHRRFMQSAFIVSTLFLISYLTYHYHIGSKRFPGQGPIRAVYFSILVSHTILAAAIVPLILTTLSRAWKGAFDRHMTIARRTLPLWIYVSVTGVVVYWMLYRM
jgi:putative membrane protein